MNQFSLIVPGITFQVMVDRGAEFAAGKDDTGPDVLGCLNFVVDGAGGLEVHSATYHHCLVQSFELGRGAVVGESMFALPAEGLKAFVNRLPGKKSQMRNVQIAIMPDGGGGEEGRGRGFVRLVATGPGLAEGIEAELPAHDAEFPDMARLYKLPNAGADFQEDIGRFALSAGELAHIAALAKPVKWAHGDAPESVAVRFAYAHGDQATPVLFSIEGSFPCYGLVMPMRVLWNDNPD